MQTLNINTENNEASQEEMGFWKRQFRPRATNTQKGFDWAFGVVLPLICMMADPIVFKGHGLAHGSPVLGSAKPFAYLLSFISIFIMVGWLLLGNRLKSSGALVAGTFFAGSAISFVVGVVLLPLSLIGMFMLIGFLGFTPLFSAFVYLRNGFRAYRSAEVFLENRIRLGITLLAGLFSLTIPYVVNREINAYVSEMVGGNAAIIYSHAERIKYFAPLVDFSRLGGHYCNSPDSKEHQALTEVYQRFTGGSIEDVDFASCNDF